MSVLSKGVAFFFQSKKGRHSSKKNIKSQAKIHHAGKGEIGNYEKETLGRIQEKEVAQFSVNT